MSFIPAMPPFAEPAGGSDAQPLPYKSEDVDGPEHEASSVTKSLSGIFGGSDAQPLPYISEDVDGHEHEAQEVAPCR